MNPLLPLVILLLLIVLGLICYASHRVNFHKSAWRPMPHVG